MVLVNAPRDAVLKPLTVVSGIVERRHTMPILANVLIRRAADTLSFLSTDLEVQISTATQCDGDAADEAVTVNARKLLDILRALPDTQDLALSLSDRKLAIKSGKSRFSLQTLAADDFPLLSVPEQWSARLTLAQQQLRHLLGMVHFAMAQQDIRYYLNGMLLVIEDHILRAVSTDGHRMAYFALETETSNTRHEVIVPRKTILELSRLLTDTDEPVTIEIAPNQIRFNFSGIEFISKLIEGKFPDYQRVLPSGYTQYFDINREALSRSLQRVSILTTEKFKGVRLVIGDNQLRISASNADQEEAQEELDIDFPHPAVDIGFNVTYLLDLLSNLKVETLRWSLSDANSSALITVPERDDFKYVVMPMRI